MGAPAVEVVQELMPEEGTGLVREIGYLHLPIGLYDTREEHEFEDAEFAEIMEEYAALIAHWDDTDSDFNNAYGTLDISQNQEGLKKLVWHINWVSADGSLDQFEKAFFLHEESMYWEQYGLKDFSYVVPESEEE